MSERRRLEALAEPDLRGASAKERRDAREDPQERDDGEGDPAGAG
jgi:hypothetical protein